MPIYEYRRPDGTTFEIQQSFSDESLTHDPDTGVKVERVLHAPAVHFKGKGFYNTDYGTRNRQRENAANAEGSSSEGSSASAPAPAAVVRSSSLGLTTKLPSILPMRTADSSSSDSSSSDSKSSEGSSKTDAKKSETGPAKDTKKSKDAKPAATKS